MEELIKRLERVIATGAPDKDGMHPISAEAVLEVVKQLSELGTNLASLGTDCISRQQAIDAINEYMVGKRCDTDGTMMARLINELVIKQLPPIQPETAKRIIGKSRGGMTLWYQCNVCNEPVDEKDAYCRGCGRRLIDG